MANCSAVLGEFSRSALTQSLVWESRLGTVGDLYIAAAGECEVTSNALLEAGPVFVGCYMDVIPERSYQPKRNGSPNFDSRGLKSLERRMLFLPQEGVEPKVPLSGRQAGMAQDHLRDDLNGSSGSARKGRCMAS